MKILVINAGSSSLKFQLIDMDNESVIAKGLVERIGTVDPTTDLTYEWDGQKIKQKQLKKCATHAQAMEIVLDVLVGKDRTASEYDANDGKAHLTGTAVIADLKEIGAVGHRVLHGGEKFTASCLIDDAPRLPGGAAGRAPGGRVRHRLPPDHAPQGVPLRHSQ